jgi:hypothetical protein
MAFNIRSFKSVPFGVGEEGYNRSSAPPKE